MTIFRSKRAEKAADRPDFIKGERLLWIENRGDQELRIMLEPWCNTVDVPPGQFAKLTAFFMDELDEFHIQHHSDRYLGVYCPPETTITVVEER
jgi:hypothetical protein